MKFVDIAPWPYWVAAVPAAVCLVYRAKRHGVSGLWRAAPMAGLLYSGAFTCVLILGVAATGELLCPIAFKERLVFGASALAVLLMSSVHAFRGTPFGDKIRRWLGKSWWGASYIVEAHPLAFARLGLSEILAILEKDGVDHAMRAKETFEAVDSRIHTVIERLKPTETIVVSIRAASKECRDTIGKDVPDVWDRHVCRQAVNKMLGIIEGMVDEVPPH